jgi:hypothetical protein
MCFSRKTFVDSDVQPNYKVRWIGLGGTSKIADIPPHAPRCVSGHALNMTSVVKKGHTGETRRENDQKMSVDSNLQQKQKALWIALDVVSKSAAIPTPHAALSIWPPLAQSTLCSSRGKSVGAVSKSAAAPHLLPRVREYPALALLTVEATAAGLPSDWQLP